MTDAPHPARSPEFLSRFYDGELGAAEDAAFAEHRATCAECRAAAEAFSATLREFRASPTTAPAPDLSARILRRIRAQSPSRRPFGVTFGIDVRWAGVLVAALLVLLLAAPLLLRREPIPSPARVPAIPARILDEPPAQANARGPRGDREHASPASPSSAPERPAPRALAKDEAAAANAPSMPAEAPADEEKVRVGLAPPVRQKAAGNRVTAEPSGGEAGTVASPSADAAEAPARVLILAADGFGPPPAVVSRPAAARLAALRGHEFVLLVETGGRVRSAVPAGTTAPGTPSGADVLREIVFSPGDRPRRLTVRVE